MTEHEFKGMVMVCMTAMTRVKESDLSLSKSLIALCEDHMKGIPMDVDAVAKMLDDGIVSVLKGVEEMQVFRNMIRDDRPKRVKDHERHAERFPHSFRGDVEDMPRSQRDPKVLLARLVAQQEKAAT